MESDNFQKNILMVVFYLPALDQFLHIVCDKEELVNSSNLQAILFKVLRRVYRSSLNVGLCRRKCEVDSISKPQLQIGFKGCVCYIFASLFFMSKKEHL